MDLQGEPGFLGTNASLLADLTLIAYLAIIIPAILIGFFFARRKWFEPHHKLTMTAVTLVNWGFIGFVMAVSYVDSVSPNVPESLGEDFIFVPTIHLLVGLTAQLIASYLVIRMWFEKQLPDWFKVENIKRYMRITMGLWLLTAALGLALYVVWYSPEDTTAQDAPPPASTEEATSETLDGEQTPSADEPLSPVTTPELQP